MADALCETVGPDEARVLESELLSRYPTKFSMPRAQALLLALRQVLPTVSDSVLQRSAKLYGAGASKPIVTGSDPSGSGRTDIQRPPDVTSTPDPVAFDHREILDAIDVAVVVAIDLNFAIA